MGTVTKGKGREQTYAFEQHEIIDHQFYSIQFNSNSLTFAIHFCQVNGRID